MGRSLGVSGGLGGAMVWWVCSMGNVRNRARHGDVEFQKSAPSVRVLCESSQACDSLLRQLHDHFSETGAPNPVCREKDVRSLVEKWKAQLGEKKREESWVWKWRGGAFCLGFCW